MKILICLIPILLTGFPAASTTASDTASRDGSIVKVLVDKGVIDYPESLPFWQWLFSSNQRHQQQQQRQQISSPHLTQDLYRCLETHKPWCLSEVKKRADASSRLLLSSHDNGHERDGVSPFNELVGNVAAGDDSADDAGELPEYPLLNHKIPLRFLYSTNEFDGN